MKAQRRHELQENELAKVIKHAPNFWQESGGKFLAVCVAIVIIVVLIRFRISSNRQAAVQATENLATARAVIDELDRMTMSAPGAPADLLASRRRVLFNDANNAINEAIRLLDDPKVQAEALLAKGDLNWTLAAQPTPASPTTAASSQPSAFQKDPKELADTATEAYQTIVSNFADQKYAAVAARFGLAALAEQRRDFAAAKTQYDQIALDTKDMQAYQQMASVRLAMLDRLKDPPLLAKAATLPAIPTTGPTAELPVGIRAFATAPTTQAAGATQPAVTAAPATEAAATTAPAPATQAR